MSFFKSIAKFFSAEKEQVIQRYPERNELCWCGSGMKYKKCHLADDEKRAGKKTSACCIKS